MVGEGISLAISPFIASVAVPVWGQIVCVVVIGIAIANVLNGLDKQYDLSNKLIDCIKKGMKEQQKIAEWNARNSVNGSSFYWENY